MSRRVARSVISCLSNLLFVCNAITSCSLCTGCSLSKTLEIETDIFALFTLSDFYSSIKVNGPIIKNKSEPTLIAYLSLDSFASCILHFIDSLKALMRQIQFGMSHNKKHF